MTKAKTRAAKPRKRKTAAQQSVDEHIPGLDQKQAWDRVAGEVRAGRMPQPGTCAVCDAQEKTWAHHWRGYEYPLDVWWVCSSCNRLLPHHDGSETLEQARQEMPARKAGAGAVSYRAGQASRVNVRRAGEREIGDIPDIEDPERREACLSSLKLFCDTYNPEAFSLPWSDTQLESVARIEETVKGGGLYAFAEARGSGKTSRVRMAALWAVSYALCRYAFVIGATDSKAADTLSAVKMFIRFLPTYAADFPEISYPIQRLEGISNRAAGQTCNGVSTCIEWTADRIVFPTVMVPRNWPQSWPTRGDGCAPTSGAVFSTSGLTGEGIRGSLKTLTTGEQVRPDLVLLDDPQTAESAGSLTQNQKREHLISADVLGMAGPGKKLAVVMPCTIIAPGDAMDSMTDREKHPLWRGARSGILSALPDNLGAWDDYFNVYERCAQKEPPDFGEANQHYADNRPTLDAGAQATWEARKLPDEVSAVQHAMNLYCRDRRAFMSEYMNKPDPVAAGLNELKPEDVKGKINGLPRGTVATSAARLTAFIDCGSDLLFWCVVGWDEKFSGMAVDYGTFPAQTRSYFAATDARPKLSDLRQFAGLNEDARVYEGLKALVGVLLSRSFQRAAGGTEHISRCLVDAGNWTKTVSQFCNASPYRHILTPSKGWGIGSGKSAMANWPVMPGERKPGDHWRDRVNKEGVGRMILFDANHWKTFVHRALAAAPASPGCLQLFGTDPEEHRLFADHLTSEYRKHEIKEKLGDQSMQDLWAPKPGKPDNHWLDCLVGCAVAASVAGTTWSVPAVMGEAQPVAVRKTIKLSDEYYRKHGGRRR